MRRSHLDSILHAMLSSHRNISDLVFAVGKPPQVESDGELREVVTPPGIGKLTAYQTERIALNVIGDNRRLLRELLTRGACDCAYALEDQLRFRVNIYKQRGHFSLVMRRTQMEMPTLSALGLPPVFRDICKEKNGLIFVTGAAGSGKTTTLSALVDEINATQPVHIITLEDPIEFVHEQKRATLSQRELGEDFPDFSSGLRSALRQGPKVILVGEIRDRATLEIALAAGETGHLVLTTMHTISAGQTINRIAGMFDAAEQSYIRLRLVETMRYIVSQRLVPKIGGGRHLVQEVMGSNLRVRDTIVNGEGEGRSFYDLIDGNTSIGWHTFDQSLTRAAAAGMIEDETALLYANNRNKLTRMLDDARKQQGRQEPKPEQKPGGLNMRLTA
ncbi:MAG TPA: PilT/PilU family type 4a pilus ATPase [Chthoniobacteraceae bacterium]|jgi:twitching motility protein PilT|nr:PilT/PilU family type 4a pilus ATPase [Chthoniobacteraceae bacterium]